VDFTPSIQEAKAFEQFRRKILDRAENAFTLREALDIIRSDHWQWHPDFFRKASPWGS
jgi:hypothetical protein